MSAELRVIQEAEAIVDRSVSVELLKEEAAGFAYWLYANRRSLEEKYPNSGRLLFLRDLTQRIPEPDADGSIKMDFKSADFDQLHLTTRGPLLMPLDRFLLTRIYSTYIRANGQRNYGTESRLGITFREREEL